MCSTSISKLLLSLLLFFSFVVNAQVGIGTINPHTSSILDIESTNSGVLLPRIGLTSTSDNSTITNPEASLLIYNTSTVNDVTPGFYFWQNGKWNKISTDTKIFGDIYKSSASAVQALDASSPISFGSIAICEGVLSDSNHFEIVTPGYYRVTYSISLLKTAGSPINLGFYLTKSSDPADKIEGSFVHTQLDEFRNINISMNKIIYLDTNEKIFLYPDISNGSVAVMSNAATLNIELIKSVN
ncbi:hypothetical protein C1T31_09680 [Hanstruepera neustonica]|uniref:BclA C-terminal domain-containing protein n=1 Tax=Hanstruepera neustonica TaxID=1445657 RepID=A0A2K1DXL7_9FLAO|nr:hypothetical protein [Hanstruepera neustonica]PNQ72771.1 hypothetical protein C1T31_09680 [Hanstruepera neustonica]